MPQGQLVQPLSGSHRCVPGQLPRHRRQLSNDPNPTDGIDVYAGSLGPAFPNGLFVCQDGFNDTAGTSGTQNFKYVRLDAVPVAP